jgi:uncharacterized membrane protein YdjX (TVP38/TMEM64 family)
MGMGPKARKRLALAAAIAALVVAFELFDLGRFLTLSHIKASQERFSALYGQNQALFLGAYFLVYIASTALSLPGATILTLGGGALFGFWVTLALVSFASSIGATLACAASRFVLRDWVQGRLGERLKTVNEGIEREGAFYLFTLRLIPLLPFWMINLVMGLTRMPLGKYYWVSQVGMLPGTAVYVNAGKELGRIDSLAGILSPGLIVSFAVLGLFPLAVRKGVDLYRARVGRPPGGPRPETPGRRI